MSLKNQIFRKKNNFLNKKKVKNVFKILKKNFLNLNFFFLKKNFSIIDKFLKKIYKKKKISRFKIINYLKLKKIMLF